MAAIQECGFRLIQQLPFSPDLPPSDYYLLLKTKRELCNGHCDSDNDVIAAVDRFVEVRDAVSLQ